METITTGWWNCPDCGVEVELAVGTAQGCEVPCPDCGSAMSEQ